MAAFWVALFGFVMTVVITTDWESHDGVLFALQLSAILGGIALFFGAAWLWAIRDDKDSPLKPWPTVEERELAKLHADMDRRERILESREKLANREQELLSRRDEFIEKIEKRARLR